MLKWLCKFENVKVFEKIKVSLKVSLKMLKKI